MTVGRVGARAIYYADNAAKLAWHSLDDGIYRCACGSHFSDGHWSPPPSGEASQMALFSSIPASMTSMRQPLLDIAISLREFPESFDATISRCTRFFFISAECCRFMRISPKRARARSRRLVYERSRLLAIRPIYACSEGRRRCSTMSRPLIACFSISRR